MSFLIVVFVMLAGFYHLGRLRGEARERDRHARAVSEATENITSMRDWTDKR